MATPLVGEGDAVGRELLAVEVLFRLFELQILVLGASLSPEVNLRGSGRHSAAHWLRHRLASPCSTSTRPTRRLWRMQPRAARLRPRRPTLGLAIPRELLVFAGEVGVTWKTNLPIGAGGGDVRKLLEGLPG